MIKAPNWAPDAVPTTRGWVHPRTGELLKSQKISAADVKAYLEPVVEETKPKRKRKSAKTTLTEAPVNDKSLEEMTETELQNVEFEDVAPEVLTEESENDD